MSGGGGGCKDVVVGHRYQMGTHLVLCHGPVDSIVEMRAGDYTFDEAERTEGTVLIEKQLLFGGDYKEGGIYGYMELLFGGDTQTTDSYLETHIGTPLPAFRGLVSIIAKRMWVSSNTPYIKPWRFKVKRTTSNWYASKAEIDNGETKDRNPAHIIYEVLTCPTVALPGDVSVGWGVGYAESDLDLTSFESAADTLYSEGFGLSIVWEAEDQTAEDFIQEVLRHIDGTIYMNQSTGKLVLKLIRDDYDEGTLSEFDEDNILEVRDYNEQLLHDTINEVKVIYYDQVLNRERTVTVHDIALQHAVGGVVSQSNHYHGISNQDLAAKIALRDLKQMSSRIIKMTLIVNREGYAVKMGDSIKVSYPDYGLQTGIFRVVKVDYGELLDGRVRLELVTDVFAVEDSVYFVPDDSNWTSPYNDPAACPNRLLREATYWELVRRYGQTTVDNEDQDYGCPVIAATKPSGDTYGGKFYIYESGAYRSRGSLSLAPMSTLDGAITATDTIISISEDLTNWGDLDDATVENKLAYIGDELVEITAYTDGQISVNRGILDTVPTAHADGTKVWFFEEYHALYTYPYVAGQTVRAKVTTSTLNGTLSLAAAPEDTYTFDSRMYRPYAPGNVLVNSQSFPDFITGALSISWAHRDRTQQTTHDFITQSDGNVGPETGTTYTLTIYDENDTQIREYTGVSGDSQSYSLDDEISDFGHADSRPCESLRIELKSVRDSYDSWQTWNISIDDCYGYGMFYGDRYGE